MNLVAEGILNERLLKFCISFFIFIFSSQVLSSQLDTSDQKIKPLFPSKIKIVECNTDDVNCYHQQLEEINSSAKELIRQSGADVTALSSETLDLNINPSKKSEVIVVMIHGLYGSGGQYMGGYGFIHKDGTITRETGLKQQLLSRWIPNISLVLPGHGLDQNRASETHYSEWLNETESSLKLAKKLGNKVVLVGQSTGGLLAYRMALKFPELVDSLVLIEPALKVQPHLQLATCGAGKIFKTTDSLKKLASLIGLSHLVKENQSLSIGCEVVKLGEFTNEKDSQNQKTEANVCFDCNLGDFEKLTTYNISDTFPLIKTPTLLINNENDEIVDSEKNIDFAHANKNVQYEKIRSGMPHGSYIPSTTIVNYLINQSLILQENTQSAIYRDFVNQIENFKISISKILKDTKDNLFKNQDQIDRHLDDFLYDLNSTYSLMIDKCRQLPIESKLCNNGLVELFNYRAVVVSYLSIPRTPNQAAKNQLFLEKLNNTTKLIVALSEIMEQALKARKDSDPVKLKNAFIDPL